MVLRAKAANARHNALNKAEIGTSAANSQTAESSGGGPRTLKWPSETHTVTPTLIRFNTAVTMLKSIIVSNLPSTISLRWAGLESKVSRVPRSFSPAHRSTAG